LLLQWRRLPNKELNDLYLSPNIIRVIKSRRMRWVRHVDMCMQDLGDLAIDGRTMLTWVFNKWDGEAWTGLI
jgi:hypothetical protein